MTETDFNIEMWECKKYPGLSVMADTAEAFCAKRFEASKRESGPQAYSRCATCDRGAIMFDLGKHKADRRATAKRPGDAVAGETNRAKSETIPGKIETITTQGEAHMGTRTFKKNCTKHGEFITTGPAGKCPTCKEEQKQVGSHEVTKRTKKGKAVLAFKKESTFGTKPGKDVDLRLPVPASGPIGLEVGGGRALTISIDLSRFPKLHSRLVMTGLNTMLAELETKV